MSSPHPSFPEVLAIPHLVPDASGTHSVAQVITQKEALARDAEQQLFQLRDTIEVLWIEMGAVMSDIVEQKLYQYRQDEQGNYFRTAKAYFEYLDKRFAERGWTFSRATLYRYVSDYRLFVRELGYSAADCAALGKSTLRRLAPGVQRLLDEQKPDEAKQLVNEVLTAIEANEGLPLGEVDIAVDDATGRVMKWLQVEFEPRAVGYRLKTLTLWWGADVVDVLRHQVTEKQAAWIAQRLGNKFGEDAK